MKPVARALAFFCSLLLAGFALAGSPHKEAITFSLNRDVGFGNSVFVTGNHADLGAGDVTQALKLRYTAGNNWTGQIAIQSGTALDYHFVARTTANNSWCDAANASGLTATASQNVSAQPAAPYHGKTLYYLSGWSDASLSYRQGASWTTAPMSRIDTGRMASESLFKISGIGEAGENLEFVFTDGNGHFDNPAGGGNYLTNLDDFYVQDGNVFQYLPSANPSAPQIVSHFVDSTAPNIPGRTVHIYLPRGYQQHSDRRYPVVYFGDGQNVFDPGGQFGSWSADATATREISQGRMREAILVAIDNSAARIPEYMPPGDSYQNTAGRGDAYASFVINNVRPYVDTTYRTLNNPANTVTVGSSLGGLIALYFGREFSTFGKIGVFSPAFWIAPNYVASVAAGAKKPLRVYLDMGTAEPADDFDRCLQMYDTHLAQGYVANDDLDFAVGCGQAHDEAAWAARLPAAFHYLLPAREDPAELAQRDYPPVLSISLLDLASGHAQIGFSALQGFTYTLQRSPDLSTWTSLNSSSAESLPWANRSLEDSALPAGTKMFWRLRATPSP